MFDAGRTQSDPVRRDDKANGSHFVHFYDYVVRSPVAYENRTYVVTAATIRTNFAIRYWGRPILVALGLSLGGVAVLTAGFRRLRSRC